jgi:hypothetical protein
MERDSIPIALSYRASFPPPPAVHWAVLFVAIAGSEGLVLWLVPEPFRDFLVNLVIAAWPIYLCLWIRKIDLHSLSLYWALASFATGFLFSWLLWIVVIFEIREELLEHYNRREPIGLRLNLVMTLLFSFVYFQYHLNRITKEKNQFSMELVGAERVFQSSSVIELTEREFD